MRAPAAFTRALLAALLVAAPLAARADDETPKKDEKPSPYEKDKPAEEKSSAVKLRYPPSSVRVPIIVSGLLITGAAWGVAFGCGMGWPEVPGSKELRIPIVGPWLALGKSGCAPDDPDCGAKVYVRGVLYVIDAITQLAGLGLVAQGIFMKTEAKAKSAGRAPFLGMKKGDFSIAPVPGAGPSSTGLSVVGTF